MAAYYKDSLKSFRLSPFISHRATAAQLPLIYCILTQSIISYLGGLVIRGASTLIAANYLNRFSNNSLSVIHIARDSDTFLGQTLVWP